MVRTSSSNAVVGADGDRLSFGEFSGGDRHRILSLGQDLDHDVSVITMSGR
jgi:hypothetical protein